MTEPMMAFWRARLDEEERVALAIDSAPWWQGESDAPTWDRNHVYVDGCNERTFHDLTEEEAAHVACWDPHRVTAEVAAKRAILDLYDDPEWQADGSNEAVASIDHTLVEVMRLLVRTYQGHPDFDDEWLNDTWPWRAARRN